VLLVPVLLPEVSVAPVAEVPVLELLPVAPVEVLPLADIGEVLSAALLVLPVPVELQAARLKAISAPIITPW
jgi:hypothetical protein